MKVKEALTRKSSEDLISKFQDNFYKFIDINKLKFTSKVIVLKFETSVSD